MISSKKFALGLITHAPCNTSTYDTSVEVNKERLADTLEDGDVQFWGETKELYDDSIYSTRGTSNRNPCLEDKGLRTGTLRMRRK
jgi:hypothetical protein